MKKKLCCIGVMLIAALALAACGGGESSQIDSQAKSSLDKARDNIKAITDAEIRVTTVDVIKGKDKDHQTTVKTESTIKEVAGAAGAMDMEIRYKQTVNEKAETSVAYIKDGKTYVDDGKEKVALDSSPMYQGLGNLTQNLILGLTGETLKGLSGEEKKDQIVYQITMDNEQFVGYFQKAQGLSQDGEETSAPDIKKMNLQVTADKADTVKSIKLDCVCRLPSTDGDETASEENYTLQAEFVSLNTGLTIDFPDLGKYKKAGSAGGEVQ